MEKFFTRLTTLCIAVIAFQASFSQATGDYRSNQTGANFAWSTLANWEVFNGTSWVAASHTPTSSDGVISIVTGDSIQLTSSITIDQVVIESAASLLINSATVTLNNDPSGDDIVVSGNSAFVKGLYIASSGILTTSTGATILVNSGGMMQIRNAGNVHINTTSNGELQFVDRATITDATFTSNGTALWYNTNTSANISLNNGTLINNGTLKISDGNLGNSFFSSAAAGTTNTVINSSTGIISKLTASTIGSTNSNSGVAFTNNGVLRGLGTYSFNIIPGSITNTGTLSPGNSPGIMAVNPGMINSQTVSIGIEIEDGSGPGTGNDRLDVTGSVNLNGVTINVIENIAAPRITYTIMTTTGTFTGTPTFNLPPDYTSTVGSNAITVTKNFPLPLVWGDFTAIADNRQVRLNWQTLQEDNTSYFTIQYSTDGSNYSDIATISAAGQSSSILKYAFIHMHPGLSATNFYRIRQVDIDGKSSYSAVRVVRFSQGNVTAVIATPNPIRSTLHLSVQVKNITAVLSGINGNVINRIRLQPGTHDVDMSSLPAGSYQLTVYKDGQVIQKEKLIKL